MLTGVIFIAYCTGFAITFRRVFAETQREFGRARDFGDWGTNLFMCMCPALIWPITAIAYGSWLIEKRRRRLRECTGRIDRLGRLRHEDTCPVHEEK